MLNQSGHLELYKSSFLKYLLYHLKSRYIIYMQWNPEILSATSSQFWWMLVMNASHLMNSSHRMVQSTQKVPLCLFSHKILLTLCPRKPSIWFYHRFNFAYSRISYHGITKYILVCPASFPQHLWNSSIPLHVSVAHLFWQLSSISFIYPFFCYRHWDVFGYRA